MKRLKVLTLQVGPDRRHLPGDVGDFEDEEAQQLLDGGYAELVEELEDEEQESPSGRRGRRGRKANEPAPPAGQSEE